MRGGFGECGKGSPLCGKGSWGRMQRPLLGDEVPEDSKALLWRQAHVNMAKGQEMTSLELREVLVVLPVHIATSRTSHLFSPPPPSRHPPPPPRGES